MQRLRRYPLVGHTPAFLADRLGFLDAAAAGAERAVELSIGRRTFLLVDAAEVRHVLVANAAKYEKSPRLTSRRGQRVSGRNVLTMTADRHRPHRRRLQPVFTQKAVAPFEATMVEAAAERASGWRTGQVLDVAEEMVVIARRTIIRMLLGRLAPPEEELVEAAVVWRRRHIEHVFRSFLPAPDRMPTRVNRSFWQHKPELERIVRRRLREFEGDRPDSTILGAIASALADADGGGVDEASLVQEALTLLVTGHETVADCLAWTWHLLAEHPEVERRVRAELERPSAAPPASAAATLPYAWQVISESLRLFPPTWIFVRMALDDDVLPTGVRVPRGSKLYVSQWVLHRSSRYFPDPTVFDPGRFDPEAAADRPRHAYFPFGFGPRVCIGETVARLELLTVLATLARRYRFAAVEGRPVEPEPGITLRPRYGIRMRVEPADSGGHGV